MKRSKPNATSKSVIQGYRPFLSSPVFKNQFLSLYVWQAVRMGENQLAFICDVDFLAPRVVIRL